MKLIGIRILDISVEILNGLGGSAGVLRRYDYGRPTVQQWIDKPWLHLQMEF